jgi:hypothetical protein
LFVKIENTTGKKDGKTRTKIVKALVDTGDSASIVTFKLAKGLLPSNKTTKKWSTAVGVLNTSAKT